MASSIRLGPGVYGTDGFVSVQDALWAVTITETEY
jgi:hypothetical protein